MKFTIPFFVLAVAVGVLSPLSANALSLKMQPLSYNGTLEVGEVKKGFVDVSNPTSQTLQLKTSVRGFTQTDNNGSLKFYDDPQISAGIIPDLSDFELGPMEAIRMYFVLDGKKLPEGDIFAALFVTTQPDTANSKSIESVQLGTILTVVNGKAGPRTANIESLNVDQFQFGSNITGAYVIKNTTDDKVASGFYPEVTLKLTPFGGQITNRSPLVMAGRSRESQFAFNGSHIGLYKLSAIYGSSDKSSWVFVLTGFWRLILPFIVFVFIVGLGVMRHNSKPPRYGNFRIR